MPADDLFAIAPYTLRAIDSRSMLVIRVDTGVSGALDVAWSGLLDELRVFRSLADHAQVLMTRHPRLQGQKQGLIAALRSLRERGILVAASALSEAYARASGARDDGPPVVCIRTCDRPEALKRLLTSLFAEPAHPDSTWPVEVYDDSRTDAAIGINRKTVSDLSARFNLFYVGRDEQAALLQRLTDNAPEDRAHLSWLLSADESVHQGQPTHGLMLNHAFLRNAGRRLLLIDDDAVLDTWTGANTDWRVRFERGGVTGAPVLEESTLMDGLRPYPPGVLKAHVDVLGKSLPAAARAMGAPLSAARFHEAAYSLAVAPRPEQTRVRYSINGTLGDPGTLGDHALLFDLGRTRPDLVGDAERYAALCAAPRLALGGQPPCPRLGKAPGLHLATVAGIDTGPYIGPLLPAGRGEDALLGTQLMFLYPNDYGLTLPIAVVHRPVEPRSWMFAPEALLGPASGSATLASWMAMTAVAGELSPQQRLVSMAQGIAQSATAGDLEAAVARLRTLSETERLAWALSSARRLASSGATGCNAWREDVTAVGTWAASRLQRAEPPSPADVSAIAGQLREYAQALPAWNRAWDLACTRALGAAATGAAARA